MTTTFRLRELLAEHGLTQAEAAALAGVGVQTVSRLCRNATAQVSLDTLDRLATALGVTPADLLEYEQPRPAKHGAKRRRPAGRR